MSPWSMYVQKLAIAALLTLVSWIIVDRFIIEIGFVKYFLIEVLFVVLQKIQAAGFKYLNLESNDE